MLRTFVLTLVGGGGSGGRGGKGRPTTRLARAVGVAVGAVGTMWIAATVSGHEDRQTLVAANSTKAYGVGTFRVTQRNGGFWPEEGTYPTKSQVRAEILDSNNGHLGKFREVLYWKQVWEANLKPPRNKNLLVGQDYELEWGGEHIKVEMRTEEKTTTVWYNGKQVLGATIDPKNKKAQTGPNDNPALLEQRKELFDITGAIEKDLRDAFPPPPKPITCCGSGGSGEVVCSGGYVSGDGSGFNKTAALINARNAANLNCWNQYCTGCCEIIGEQCWCVGDIFPALQGLLCSCNVVGRTCRCQQGYI